MNVEQANTPTSSHDDEQMERLYEYVKLAMRKVETQYVVVTGEFIANVVGKQAGEQALGNYGIDSSNTRGEIRVEFTERNRLRTKYLPQEAQQQISCLKNMLPLHAMPHEFKCTKELEERQHYTNP